MIRIDDKTWVIASPSSWIEGEATRQLQATAALPGVTWTVGMPDLHPGKGHPIGAATLTSGVVYPHLVGGDIGCGMALFDTETAARKVNAERLAKRFSGLEGEWSGEVAPWLAAHSVVDASAFVKSLGTIGGGNHFAELQAFDEITDVERVASLGLDAERLVLLVHSGSRGLGDSILREHTSRLGAASLEMTSAEGVAYLAKHDDAVRWAAANRALIAHRVADAIGTELRATLDLTHNGVTQRDGGWLHRKGAAPHDAGVVVIPGSRGTLSYLVEPTGDGATCGHSLAHGAGRKWTRSDARARLRERYRADDLRRTPLGGVVICEDKELLFEEAPDAYKRIDRVVADLVEAGVCRVLATLKPVVTYKTRHDTPRD